MTRRRTALPPRLVESALRPLYAGVLHHRMPVPAQRRLLDLASVLQPVPRGVRRSRTVLGGRPAEVFTAAGGAAPDGGGPAVLYLHGGGFVTGSPRTHRPLTARIARDTGAVVYSLDYRLAPEHPCPAAVDDAVAAYAELVDVRGHGPGAVAIAGDSAGGGIAAAATRRILDARGAPPAALVLIAPAVDPAADPALLHDDAVLHRGWVSSVCAAYRGGLAADDPDFAPAHADPRGFPPTYVQVGEGEMLRPQAVAYAGALREAGVDVRLTVSPELWHVAQLQAGLVREAAAAADEATAFLRTRLG